MTIYTMRDEATTHADAMREGELVADYVTTTYDRERNTDSEFAILPILSDDAEQWWERYGDQSDPVDREVINARYHASIIRAWRTNGTLNVGSVVILATGDNARAACRYCGNVLTLTWCESVTGSPRDAQELFTMLVIAHGNNEIQDRTRKITNPQVIDTVEILSNYRA